MYVIEEGKIVETIKQVGFYSDKVIYSFDSKYNFKIYNKDLDVIKEFKLEDSEKIDKINSVEYYNDDTLLIRYSSLEKDYKKLFNYEGRKVKSSDKVLLSNSMYYVVHEDNKVIVYGLDDKKLTETVGKVNYIDNNFIILDKVLYRIVVE